MINIPFPKTRAKFPVHRPISTTTKAIGIGVLIAIGFGIGLYIHNHYEAKAEWAFQAGKASVTRLCTDQEALKWWTGTEDMLQVKKQLCK